MQQELSHPVPLHEPFRSWRLGEYLAVLWPQLARRGLDALFAAGRIRSGGRPVGAECLAGQLEDLVLAGGIDDVPRIPHEGAGEGIEVLHEDEHLTVLSKPPGISVVPDARQNPSCLGYLVRRELEARARKSPGEYIRPRTVHRLDRSTSGLVLMARTPEAERALGECFEARRVLKEYLALAVGDVESLRTVVLCPVGRGRGGRMRAGPRGKSAETTFDVLERFGRFTLLLVRPRTGRRHQIRVHARAMGHPLAGDALYQDGTPQEPVAPPGLERLALHAWRYTLPREWPGRRELVCPLAVDLARTLETLRAR